MAALPDCRIRDLVPAYFPLSVKNDSRTLDRKAGLDGALPAGFLNLSVGFGAHSTFRLQTAIAGKYTIRNPRGLGSGDLEGLCAGATHVITGATVGAFSLSAAGEGTANASNGVVSVRASDSETRLRSDGNPALCEAGEPQSRPPRGCSAIVRVDASPLSIDADAEARMAARLAAMPPKSPTSPVGPACSLAAVPFNAMAPELHGDEGTRLIRSFPTDVCREALRMGAGGEKIEPIAGWSTGSVPYMTHTYTFRNAATGDGYFYQYYIDRFELKLHPDAIASIDLDHLQCVTEVPTNVVVDGEPLRGCNGRTSTVYGGTRIAFDRQAGTVTWEFGMDNKNVRPVRYGSHGAQFADISEKVFGIRVEGDRFSTFSVSLVLKTKPIVARSWTATTSGRVLFRPYAIRQDSARQDPEAIRTVCLALGDFSKLCPVPPPKGADVVMLGTNGQQAWQWFDVGGAATIWVNMG